MKSSLCLTWSVLVGLFLLTSNAEAARATTLILGKSKPEPKIDTPPTGEEEAVVSASPDSQLGNETASAGNVTKLTGVPQIDYIYDPNLPRELNGYNLTDYPFYNSIPEDIDFKCDGLHDGFYASIPHKCQVYHHCLFGTRYDFLCANYTAFDQKTFICHFASEVDCKNSPKYFKRNEALYKAASTTTLAPPVPAVLTRRPPEGPGGRRRRPGNRRRKPVYDYYDDYEDSGEQDYYDDGPPGRKRKRPRPHNRDNVESSEEREEEDDKQIPSGPNKSLFDRPRIAPKIRRPVPVNEREKYDYGSDSRAILAKEPVVEKTRYENRDSENRKANHRPDYHESSPQGNAKNKESDDKISDRDKEGSRDDYERDRERERERDRPREKNHGRDDYDSGRERERGRDSDRDDYDSDRERDRDRDRPRDRDRDDRPFRRPPKKRRRPDEDDDYEYEDVRRYRNRNRPRYDEYDDDYDYDDRPYRPRIRDSDYRSREHDYDRDKGYRNRDPDYDRPRNRDRIRDDKPIRNRDIESRPPIREEKPIRTRDEDRPVRSREDERPHRTRDSDDDYRGDEDRQGRPKNKPPPYRGDVKSDKNTRTRDRDSDRYYSEAESKKSVVRDDYDDEPDTGRTSDSEQKSQKVPIESKTRLGGRQEPEKNVRPLEGSRNREVVYDDGLRTTERPYRNRDSTDRIVRGRPTPEPVPEEEKVRTEEPDVVIPRFGNTRTTERTQIRGRTGTIQKLKVPVLEKEPEVGISEEEEKQIRTVPVRGEVKPQPEQNNRKPTLPKRVYFPRPPTTEAPVEVSSKRQGPLPVEPKFPQQVPQPNEPLENLRPRSDVPRPREPVSEEPEPEEPVPKPSPETPPATRKPEPSSEAPIFKVPFEEQDSEELAPQAPKYIHPSSRRRPFLPSRGGNPNLPRGLLPVGNKALSTPRGFQKSEKTDEVPRSEPEAQAKPPPPPPIEFRAKLTTAIGVQQPKLSAALYEDTPVELTEPESDPNYYRSKEAGQQDYRNDYYDDFRPLIITPQQSNRNVQDSYNAQPEKESPVRGNYHPTEEAASSEVKDSLQHRPIQYTQPKSPILVPGVNQQVGPQTFYSDNPKFKTTVTIPERFVQKPTASTLNYHTATHLPIYHPGLQSSYGVNARPDNSPKDYVVEKGTDNHKPLIIKFPPPEKENLDDTDEYDVSLNDALQPISTLHPRNAPTGVFLTNAPRIPQTNGFKRRNQQAPHVFQDQGEYPERHQVLKRVRIETRSAPHLKKPLVPRPDASNLQQRYALPPGVYHSIKPNNNFFAILSR